MAEGAELEVERELMQVVMAQHPTEPELSRRKAGHTYTYAARGGCHTCDGEPVWTTGNALALAAMHARKYGHRTWAYSRVRVDYDGSPL